MTAILAPVADRWLTLRHRAGARLREGGVARLVEPEQPEAFAAAMRRLSDDGALRAELGRKGRAFAEARLDREPAFAALERELLG